MRHIVAGAFELAEKVACELEQIGLALSHVPKIQDAGELAETLRMHVSSAREEKERTNKLVDQMQSMSDQKEELARKVDVMKDIQEATKRDMDAVRQKGEHSLR